MTSWWFIETAPRNATWVEVMLADGTQLAAHYAKDLSGEEQPPFEGWFKAVLDSGGRVLYYTQIPTPDLWRPLTE